MNRKLLVGIVLGIAMVAAVAVVVVVAPGRAAANPPTHQTVDISGTFTLPTSFTGCSFVVTLTQTGSAVQTTYFDQSGNPTDIFLRSSHVTATYYSQSGTAYTSNSPASVHIDLVNNTITYDGLQAHIVIPGQGLIGGATGHVTFNTQTGALLVAHGQTTFLTPFSPQICSLLAQ